MQSINIIIPEKVLDVRKGKYLITTHLRLRFLFIYMDLYVCKFNNYFEFLKINNGAINHVDQGAPHVQVKLTVTVLMPFLFYNPPPNLSE